MIHNEITAAQKFRSLYLLYRIKKKGIQSYLKIKMVRKNLRTQILKIKTDNYYHRHLIIIYNSLKGFYFPPG